MLGRQSSSTLGRRTRAGAAVVATITCAALTGCSSSTSPQAVPPATSVPGTSPASITASAPSTPSSSPADSSFTTVGTLSYTQNGITQSETFAVGQMQYAPAMPPADVVSACNYADPTTQQESIYIPGSLTLSYTGNNIPATVTIDGSFIESTDVMHAFNGVTAFQHSDGTWNCQSDTSYGGSAYLTIPSGQSVTVNFWVLDQLLSPQQPKVPATLMKSWAFTDPFNSTLPVTASGQYAKVFNCSTQALVGLYGPPAAPC